METMPGPKTFSFRLQFLSLNLSHDLIKVLTYVQTYVQIEFFSMSL